MCIMHLDSSHIHTHTNEHADAHVLQTVRLLAPKLRARWIQTTGRRALMFSLILQYICCCLLIFKNNSCAKLRIRRYVNNLSKSSEEVRKMYNGSASESDLGKEEFMHVSSASFPYTISFMHACMIFNDLCSSGTELKRIFLEAGGNFDMVETSVKKWVSERKSSEEVTSRVTKRMLKEKYFWDEL